jgi:phage/plasmid-like protein (TIGR03299 family)
MPAGLANKSNGETALWLNGQPAWHKTGKVWNPEVDGEVTVERVMQEAGLDWDVELRPMFWGQSPDSVMGLNRADVGKMWGNVRIGKDGEPDKLLGTVGNLYTPFQNHKAFEFLSWITKQDAGYIESAGLLSDGATVFVSMVLGEDIVLDGAGIADRIRKFVLFKHAHDGSGKITAGVTGTRVVCTNTLNYAVNGLDDRTKFEVKHTEGGIEQLKAAAEALRIVNTKFERLEADANVLLGMRMTKREFEKFLYEVVHPLKNDAPAHIVSRVERQRNTAMELWVAQTNEMLPDSGWKAMNVITEQIDHFADLRVPKSLRIEAGTPDSLAKDIAKGARVVNGSDAKRKTELHAALLTWKR